MGACDKIVFSTHFLDDATRAFAEENGVGLELLRLEPGRADADLSPEELARILTGAQGWVVGHVRIDAALLDLIPSVKVIARRGVGHEKVDLAAAAERGKVVTIARGGNEETVADHTVALMLAVARRLNESQEAMKAGRWSILVGTDLYAKTVGLIGLGSIARKVVRRLQGFGVKILASTRTRDEAFAAANGIELVEREELLRRSDYVSLHTPLNAGTAAMIDARALSLMKPGAILINTSRAGLVEEEALLDALRDKRLGGAGLDLLTGQSDLARRPIAEALLHLPNTVVSPHSAASTNEALARTNMVAVRTIVDVLAGRSPPAECVVADGRSVREGEA